MQPHPSQSTPLPFSPGHARYQSLDYNSRPPPPPPVSRPRIRSMLDGDPEFHRFMEQTLGSSGIGRPPRPRLREGDICPVCRRALPPPGPNGNETARESHIMDCINTHDPARVQSRTPGQDAIEAPPPRMSPHMVSFVATEKDCLGEDGSVQECSICMVEYDVGDQLARLECLCKFHKGCIVQWLLRKQECPLHKIA